MTGIIKKFLRMAHVIGTKVFAVAILTVALAFTVYAATEQTNVIMIADGDNQQTVITMEENPQTILRQNGYEVSAQDDVNFTGIYNQKGTITVQRAFPVKVNYGGKTAVHMVSGGTVEQLLEEADITLGKYDKVDRDLDETVQEDDVIVVTCREVLTRVEETEIPNETVIIPTVTLAPGEQEVVEDGQTGLHIQKYRQLVVNGEKGEEKLLEETTEREPVDQQIMVGFTTQPVSSFDYGYEFDETGEPVGYSRVLRGQRAAGYSAKAGSLTASGRKAIVGHVAVNPNVIPYGSKLYIQVPGGDFIYGYAVAADTGTALTNGTIAVDLFYDSYQASANNGIKYVDIFVFE